MNKPIYVILGPTGSGKSALSLKLAQMIHGEIINADSLQVYQDLEILSARPSQSQMQGIPHHLYGYLNAYQTSTVCDWLEQAKQKLSQVENPIFVGGTGMYLSALIEGVSPIPAIDEQVRQYVRQMDILQVQERMKGARFLDPQRLRRALEVELSTGKPLTYFQELPKQKITQRDFKVFFVNPPREILYDRCNRRFLNMIENGAIEEVQHLDGINATGGVLKAIGVKEIRAWQQGVFSYEEMILKSQQATRNYAKRQVTWFRNQIKEAVLVEDSETFSFHDI